MKLRDDFIIGAEKHLLPIYRISPFKTSDILKNKKIRLENKVGIENYLSVRYKGKRVLLTENGRSALRLALQCLKLEENDIVTIITTSNKLYISSCVTNEIEKVCNWSRVIEEKTRVILINHEFGFCCSNLKKYASLGYPIIEDFAHSFISNTDKLDAGRYGDYLIFSFSKYFPIQCGGALIYKGESCLLDNNSEISGYVENVTSAYLDSINEIRQKRVNNYKYYEGLFLSLGLRPYFSLKENDCPGVFCFKTPDGVDLNKLKEFVNANGIESSVFYGEQAYFLPCHQNLNYADLDFIYMVVREFLEDYCVVREY